MNVSASWKWKMKKKKSIQFYSNCNNIELWFLLHIHTHERPVCLNNKCICAFLILRVNSNYEPCHRLSLKRYHPVALFQAICFCFSIFDKCTFSCSLLYFLPSFCFSYISLTKKTVFSYDLLKIEKYSTFAIFFVTLKGQMKNDSESNFPSFH